MVLPCFPPSSLHYVFIFVHWKKQSVEEVLLEICCCCCSWLRWERRDSIIHSLILWELKKNGHQKNWYNKHKLGKKKQTTYHVVSSCTSCSVSCDAIIKGRCTNSLHFINFSTLFLLIVQLLKLDINDIILFLLYLQSRNEENGLSSCCLWRSILVSVIVFDMFDDWMTSTASSLQGGKERAHEKFNFYSPWQNTKGTTTTSGFTITIFSLCCSCCCCSRRRRSRRRYLWWRRWTAGKRRINDLLEHNEHIVGLKGYREKKINVVKTCYFYSLFCLKKKKKKLTSISFSWSRAWMSVTGPVALSERAEEVEAVASCSSIECF